MERKIFAECGPSENVVRSRSCSFRVLKVVLPSRPLCNVVSFGLVWPSGLSPLGLSRYRVVSAPFVDVCWRCCHWLSASRVCCAVVCLRDVRLQRSHFTNSRICFHYENQPWSTHWQPREPKDQPRKNLDNNDNQDNLQTVKYRWKAIWDLRHFQRIFRKLFI